MRYLCLILVFLALLPFSAFSQCPGCIVNDCSASLPDGGICNTVIANGIAGQPYDEDVSFYMPAQVNFPDVGLIDLNRIQVISIAGLPFGINWQTSASANNNQYFPQSGQELGCIKFCGTPLAAGTYTLTVFLEADVCGIPIIGCINNVSQTYETEVTVLPGVGGAATFNFSPSGGCNATDVTFDVNQNFVSNNGPVVSIPFSNKTYSRLGLSNPPFSALSGGALSGRPFANGSCCSSNDPATDITRFTVSVTGSYNINQVQPGWDGYIYIYEGPLDWSVNPPPNFIAGNDDATTGIGFSELTGINLIANRTYYLITTGFSTLDAGPHTTIFTGPGEVGSPAFSYEWDFGNGNTSTDEVPSVQTYAPGTYTVSMITIIDTVGYELQSATINGSGCNDCTIFGCVGLPVEFPDYVVTLFGGINGSGPNLYQTPEFSDAIEPLGIPLIGLTPPLTNQIYSLHVDDIDGTLNPNDNCGTVNFDGYSSGSLTLTSGDLSMNVVISHPVIEITATADITIFPEFNVGLSAVKDTFCDGELAVLTATPASAYQWFLDTLEIVGAGDQTYETTFPGNYSVVALDSNGCVATSNMVTVDFITCICDTNVTISVSGSPFLCFGDSTILTATPGLQSYSWSNGSTEANITVGESGTYSVVAQDNTGCISTDDIFINVQSSPINAPGNLSTTNVTANAATLNWSTVIGGISYEIRGRVAGSTSPYVFLDIPGSLSNSVNVSGLFPNITYEWQVRTFCAPNKVSPSAWSSVETFTTLGGCPVPTTASTANVGSTTATLNWSAVTGATQYIVFGRPVGATSIITLNVAAPTTALNVSNLLPGVSYEWAVKANCAGAISGFSPPSTFTTAGSAKVGMPDRFNQVDPDALVIFPNPFHLKTTVLLPDPEDTYDLQLYDLTGKRMISVSKLTGTSYELERGILAKGLYIIELKGKRTYRAQVILQ